MGVYLTKMNTTTNKVEKFKVASNGAIYNNTEVVYDMTSPDANINWGYTSGIRNNITVTGKDFSKYEKLIAYCYTNYYTYPVEIDLTKHTVENFYLGRLCIGKADSMLYFAGGQTNLEKTSFTARIFRVNPATNMSNEYDEDSFYVYKIEGVLKTPSMIYTGKELNAGDGITINNGTISYSEAYSTSEHFTGKYWIDGKPIYRIVKVISVGVNATVETNLSSLNIDTLMAPHGWVKQTSGNFVYVPYYYNSSDLGACFYRSSTGVLVCKSGSGAGAGTWTMILEYTKK